MTDATLRIKNLSIALEALSRVNQRMSHDIADRIEQALQEEIDQLEKEQKENLTPKSTRLTDLHDSF